MFGVPRWSDCRSPITFPISRQPEPTGVGVDRLFTPWRFSYVTDASRMTPPCIFCDALEREGGDSLTVHVGGERSSS